MLHVYPIRFSLSAPGCRKLIAMTFKDFDRITVDPETMGGKPCVRGMRVTVGMITGMVASGKTSAEILELYPYLEADDVRQALVFAAWRVEEGDLQLQSG